MLGKTNYFLTCSKCGVFFGFCDRVVGSSIGTMRILLATSYQFHFHCPPKGASNFVRTDLTGSYHKLKNSHWRNELD